MFPDVSALFGKVHGGKPVADSVTLCERLLEGPHLATVPGAAFGAPNHIRISYATSEEILNKSIERLDRFVRELV